MIEVKKLGGRIGTCSSIGYNIHVNDMQTKLPPPINIVSVSIYKKPADKVDKLEAEAITTVYVCGDDYAFCS